MVVENAELKNAFGEIPSNEKEAFEFLKKYLPLEKIEKEIVPHLPDGPGSFYNSSYAEGDIYYTRGNIQWRYLIDVRPYPDRNVLLKLMRGLAKKLNQDLVYFSHVNAHVDDSYQVGRQLNIQVGFTFVPPNKKNRKSFMSHEKDFAKSAKSILKNNIQRIAKTCPKMIFPKNTIYGHGQNDKDWRVRIQFSHFNDDGFNYQELKNVIEHFQNNIHFENDVTLVEYENQRHTMFEIIINDWKKQIMGWAREAEAKDQLDE